ncbi:MAG: hypothetical protein FJY74_06295 [Candidatus Eisenbacteria bacterium]|nr:hypothetical protein [Candidatus Eisenbacteria bacterium]
MTEETSGTDAPSERAGGFRSQPLWLKALLVLSVAALAVGIVRCSFEATAPRAQVEAACGD